MGEVLKKVCLKKLLRKRAQRAPEEASSNGRRKAISRELRLKRDDEESGGDPEQAPGLPVSSPVSGSQCLPYSVLMKTESTLCRLF